MNKALSIFFPGKLVFGNACLQQLSAEILQLQVKSVFILSIPALSQQVHNLVAELEQQHITVFTDFSIQQEPSFKNFDNLMHKVTPLNPDLVLGLGGGSVLDVAKLVAAQLGNHQQLRDYVGSGLLSGRAKKLICAPATAGTGSEASPNAILVDDVDGQKKGIISPHLVPDIIYVDPLLTLSVPASITAATGLDALTHCLEAYTNKFAQPFIDIFAYEGMRLIAAHLVEAVKNGNNREAREKVAMGSLLGGFCLGPVNTAAVHALSYPLGSMFHLPHGLSNALLLPYVMEYNIAAAPARYASVALALGCKPGFTDEETAHKGVQKIKDIIAQCGIPVRLRDLDIPKSAIEQMAVDALKIQRLLVNNPREITKDDAVRIFETAY